MDFATRIMKWRDGTNAWITMMLVLLTLILGDVAYPRDCAGAMEIAILQSSDIAAYREAVSGFKAAGPSNAVYSEYDLQGDLEIGKKLARKVRASNVALVVAVGLKAALAAKLEIVDTPIVYMMILDPMKHRLTAPNMTGTLLEVPIQRQLHITRKFLPSVGQFGTLFDPVKSGDRFKEEQTQARELSISLRGYPVESEKAVPQQLRTLLTENDALWLTPDSTVLTSDSIRFILDSALERRTPVIAFSPEFTRLGALLSISATYTQVGRETAQLARSLLDGQTRLPLNPIPIQRLKVSVNLKTAKFLGLTFTDDATNLIDETF